MKPFFRWPAGQACNIHPIYFETMRVLPALNTRFIGVALGEGMWSEKCRACGSCIVGDYGGICPMTICAKSLLNGACGGSKNGKCEAGQDKDCAWVLIYNRLKEAEPIRCFTWICRPQRQYYSNSSGHLQQCSLSEPTVAGTEEKHAK